jgi:hypothetical protein
MQQRLSSFPAGSSWKGFIIVPALLAALVLMIALILEISRSSNTMRTSARTSDARNAVAAAEFGFEAILDQLNDDENDYLLVTKFNNGSGTGDWQTVTSTNLSTCGIKTPAAPPSANRIAGVSTNSVNATVVLPTNATASYSLISYQPPANTGASASGCDMFGNLLGGRASLTVRGTVRRNGTTTATYELVREVNIRNRFEAVENNLGLVITGNPGKSKTGSPFHIVYDQNGDGAISTSGSTITEPLGNVNCILCNSPSQLNTSGTSVGTVFTGPIPNFPTFPAMPPELTSLIPGSLTLSNPGNYPYTGSGNSGTLVPECSYLTVGGVADAEIGCRVNEMSGFGTLEVRADARPVKFFVAGKFVISGGNALYVTDGNPATSRLQDAKQYWKNLWIYGVSGTPDPGASNCSQEVTLSGSGEAVGARLWFPLGKAKISGGNFGLVDFQGSLWTCIFNQGSGNTGFLIPTDLVQTWNLGGGGGGGGAGGYRYRALGAL